MKHLTPQNIMAEYNALGPCRLHAIWNEQWVYIMRKRKRDTPSKTQRIYVAKMRLLGMTVQEGNSKPHIPYNENKKR